MKIFRYKIKNIKNRTCMIIEKKHEEQIFAFTRFCSNQKCKPSFWQRVKNIPYFYSAAHARNHSWTKTPNGWLCPKCSKEKKEKENESS